MRVSNIATLGLLALAPVAIIAPAYAQEAAAITAAKNAGTIGEQADGYLGFVRGTAGVDAELQRAVSEINIRRRAVYTDLASKEGQTVEIVAALTAEKLIARAPAGQFVKDAQRGWIRK